MNELQKIEARLAEISADVEKRGAELTAEEIAALDKEVKELKESRKKLWEKQEQRQRLLTAIAEERKSDAIVTRTFPDPAAPAEENREIDPRDTVEYRKAFMDYVCRGVPIPVELRDSQTVTAAGSSAAVPTTLLNEIIKRLESYGELYDKVRKTNIQGGVRVPIISLKPTASWVGEGASDSKKADADQHVTFNYYGLECKIAQTLLASIVTFDAFQREFVPLATEAIVKELEIGIIKGNGTNKMTGVTVDSRIPSENVISITPAHFGTWKGWKQNVFAKMKKAYRKGVFVMAQGTFDGHIDGMVDTTGQPIGRVNYGIDGAENYRFGGKTVVTVEDDVIADYDTAAAGDVIAVFMNPQDYCINSNMQMTVVEWTDHNTNKKYTKAQIICDGRLLDVNGVLIIKKGGTSPG